MQIQARLTKLVHEQRQDMDQLNMSSPANQVISDRVDSELQQAAHGIIVCQLPLTKSLQYALQQCLWYLSDELVIIDFAVRTA